MKGTAGGNVIYSVRLRKVKFEGMSSNVVTKWSLGDLWESNLEAWG